MKKLLTILVLIMSTFSLFAQKVPKINIELNDGSSKQYNISDIENLNIIAGKSGYIMKIYFQHSIMDNYLTKNISSISFDKVNMILNISGNPVNYPLLEIDSINFSVPTSKIANITSITPLFAKIGDIVTINGTDFGNSQGTGILSFKSKNATEYTGWSDTEIKCKVPQGAQNGKLSVTTNGLKSNEIDFQVIPFLVSLLQTSGSIGDTITLTGNGFGNTQLTSSVSINVTTTTGCPNWSDIKIKVIVPQSASSGKVSVTSGGIESNKLDFIILPSISNITPSNARIGDTITITGISYGNNKGFVTFTGKDSVSPISWIDNIIKVIVPMGAQNGKVYVTTSNMLKSNKVDFGIIPFLTKVLPDSAGVSDAVYITGYGFGKIQGTSSVMFNEVDAGKATWGDNVIIVNVPALAKSGKLKVNVNGQSSNELNFTIKPHITSITPVSAKIGDNVTISGYDFGDNQGTNYISIDKLQISKSQSWSDTSITFMVPVDAQSGKVSVWIGNVKSNDAGFNVIPQISGISPAAAGIGGLITISGVGFGSVKSTITFNGANSIQADIPLWSNTSVVTKVPVGAKTGKVFITVGPNPSNQVDFTVAPSIISISPAAAQIGDQITINGVSFGDPQNGGKVSFNNVDASEIISWGDGQIVVKVPVGATTGVITVKTGGGLTSNAYNFSISAYISGISPNSGSVGDQITISGANFGASRGSNYVTFNTTNAVLSDYVNWGDGQIIVKVPTGATTGKVTVTLNNVPSNGVDFSVNTSSNTTVTIGSQVWMVKNLDVTTYRNGDTIPQITDQTEWANATSGAWCYYNNDESYNSVYGKLYNWYAVNDSRGLAPDGWHVPTNAEVYNLKQFLGGNGVWGGKLKETGLTHWQNPNTGATNETGFSGLPGGTRDGSSFSSLGTLGTFHTSSLNSYNNANLFDMNYDSTWGSTGLWSDRLIGRSIRCIKD